MQDLHAGILPVPVYCEPAKHKLPRVGSVATPSFEMPRCSLELAVGDGEPLDVVHLPVRQSSVLLDNFEILFISPHDLRVQMVRTEMRLNPMRPY